MKIPLAAPDITTLEHRAIQAVLKTGRLALGSYATRFENKLARLVQRRYAVATNSGTAALHLAVRALGLKHGDEVITTPFSFCASANCLLYEGVKPVFVDIDPKTLCIDPAKIESAITPRTRAILAVDIFGHPANWNALTALARRHRLFLIEDACEALGSALRTPQGRKRCGTFGTISTFAFYPNKQITTGEGGMLLTNNYRLSQLCRSMTNQGRAGFNGKWLSHIRLGYNYRLDEMSAALGWVQLRRLPVILKRRRRVARLYTQLLASIPQIQTPSAAPGAFVQWFVYCIRLAPEINRDKIIAHLQNQGIGCAPYFPPIHLLPFYRSGFGYKPGAFPVTEKIARQTLALPFYSKLKAEQIYYIVSCLQKAIKQQGV
ncbi:MAG: DegT/DnrJ/EryC1/StrS family aminotransferase [candidate division WOR-3 bacterium]|jgi:perosamine synthetase|nr:DegT/DnrJ/EryC1/StrS family aminotransferase [candidate division WOR-3 bacterium]MCR4423985.1 DegT/DnrJ/EryC1/StrS family aminotransferase [candidate division WOR-3 bacterium]MDH7519596.1 DegT/DnrJ/EryC1/StrS family aminotransferase [bacterium]